MTNSLKPSAQKVQDTLLAFGYSNKVVELLDSTRTAQAAAEAIGCGVAQIGTSILFQLRSSGAPLMVVASGVNRVDEKHVATLLGDILQKADADFVRDRTGFVIGGVPPIGHAEAISTIIDEDLFKFEQIWAAAGHPKAVFELTPKEVVEMTHGRIMSIK